MPSFRTGSVVVALSLLMLLVSSCDSRRYSEQNRTIHNGVWKSADKVHFEVNITDTLTRYDFYLNVRNSGNYPFSNLYLFIHTRTPGGLFAVDTVECLLADFDGKWLGSGMGDIRFNRFLFEKDVRLKKAGTYSFDIEQAMRVKELNGIRDIGLRIEKSK
ncbi:MAG: gliding motility lipoprotein GldH [Bacteroidota bacterium]|nr:gliding motility lipoprotein GldH [Bacteroidota bacterium]